MVLPGIISRSCVSRKMSNPCDIEKYYQTCYDAYEDLPQEAARSIINCNLEHLIRRKGYGQLDKKRKLKLLLRNYNKLWKEIRRDPDNLVEDLYRIVLDYAKDKRMAINAAGEAADIFFKKKKNKKKTLIEIKKIFGIKVERM